MTEEAMSEVFALVVELGTSLGVTNINKLQGCWNHKLDEQWSFKVNGHAEAVDDVPPYHIAFEYNGWPAGLVSPNSGVIAAGEAANEDALVRVLCVAIEKAKTRS